MRKNSYSLDSDIQIKQSRKKTKSHRPENRDNDYRAARGEEYVRREKYQNWKYQTNDEDYDD